jgi:hypothetical protein
MIKKMPAYRGKSKHLIAQLLPRQLSITPVSTNADPVVSAMVQMCERYYDSDYEDSNTKPAGGIKFGYGGHGLPLILYSNTPNNSLFLLWLDATGNLPGKRFRALFRRINRHRTT